MILIPQRLFVGDDVRTLLRDGNNCILHKSLTKDVVGREAYVANHVVSTLLEGEQWIRTYDDTVTSVKNGEIIMAYSFRWNGCSRTFIWLALRPTKPNSPCLWPI